eukprot:TRINITY_DN3246_c0_g2_i1.p2 TRINITY_DN3246_c0_g2~~TRINITY_DN3246_c0_g2_i1.p2  ORF type:complete len:345 (+),score=98.45 TRINITY_DN3246_c0_g2_i1:84-1037(+)
MAALAYHTAQECGLAFALTYYDRYCHSPEGLATLYGAQCMIIREGGSKHLALPAATQADIAGVLEEDVTTEPRKVKITALNAVPVGTKVMVVIRAAVLTPTRVRWFNQTFVLSHNRNGAYEVVTDVMQTNPEKNPALDGAGVEAPLARPPVEPQPAAKEEVPAQRVEQEAARLDRTGEEQRTEAHKVRPSQRKHHQAAAAEPKPWGDLPVMSQRPVQQKSTVVRLRKNSPGESEIMRRPKGKAQRVMDWSNEEDFPPLRSKPAVTPRVTAAPVARSQWQEIVRRKQPSERSSGLWKVKRGLHSPGMLAPSCVRSVEQ